MKNKFNFITSVTITIYIVVLMLLLSACNETIDLKKFYDENSKELNSAVEYLKTQESISEISKEHPGFSSGKDYVKLGEFYYIQYSGEKLDFNESIENINTLADDFKFIFIFRKNQDNTDGFYVQFLTRSFSTGAKSLVYTENENELSGANLELDEKLNNNWYTAFG